MTLLSVAELRNRIDTPTSDATLMDMIAQAQAFIASFVGDPYVDGDTTIIETLYNAPRDLFLKRPVLSIVLLQEYRLGASGWSLEGSRVEGTDYVIYHDQGRVVSRRGPWSERVVVEYVPTDDRGAWRQAIINLVRLELSRSALKSESVGGEFSYTAPENWEQEKRALLDGIGFVDVI